MAQPVNQLTPLGHALAGALGGVFSNSVVYPLDTVKIVIQATKSDNKKGKRRDGLPPLSMTSLLLKIFNDEGISGFYRGYGATMINTFSTQYAYFFFYSFVRTSYIKRLAKKLPPGSPIPVLSTAAELLLGALAGALAQIFTIPVSVIAVRQQIAHTKRPNTQKDLEKGSTEENSEPDRNDDKSFIGVAKKIIKEDGVTGLWLGLKPSLVLTVNPAITYGVFERVKSVVIHGSSSQKMSPWIAFVVGALSKTLATVVTYPYIMAKVRIQAGNDNDDEEDGEALPTIQTEKTKKAAVKGQGAVQLLRQVIREEGFLGWYRGMGAQIIKAVLSQAILFVSKDQFETYALVLMNIFYRLRGIV